MPIRADLSGVQAGGFKPVPAGTYDCYISGCEETESRAGKNPGTPMVKWEFTVSPGSEHHDRKFFLNTLLVQEGDFGGLNRIKEILLAAGFPEERVDGDISFEPEEVLGAPVRCTVRVRPATEQYDESNDVRRVRPVGDVDESSEASLLP
jgi:hypothetical protein